MVQLFKTSIIFDHIISLTYALSKILLVRVIGVHLSEFVLLKSFEVNMVCFGASASYPFKSYSNVAIHCKKIKIWLFAKACDLTGGADAFNYAVLAYGCGLAVQLFDYKCGIIG